MHSVVLRINADCVGAEDVGTEGEGHDHRRRTRRTPGLRAALLPGHHVGYGYENVGLGEHRASWHGRGLEDKDKVEAVDYDVCAHRAVAAVCALGPEVPDELLGLRQVELLADLGVHGEGVHRVVKALAQAAEDRLGVVQNAP